MNTLFFDIQITGHHSEYINHLVDYLSSAHFNNYNFYFVVHPQFAGRFPKIVEKTRYNTNIQWIKISEKEFQYADCGNTLQKSIRYYRLMNKYALQVNADHVHLLYFNIFQLAVGIFRSKYTMSGILFLQFYRMQPKTIKDKLKYYRKYWQTWFYSRNKKLKTIFVLNDEETAYYLNEQFKTDHLFKMLPDPIPELRPLPQFDIYKEYKIDKKKKIYLHIGSLDERKGTTDILDSIPSIEPSKQTGICLLFAGKAKGLFEQELADKIKYYQQNFQVQIIWDNNFVSDEKMKSLFEQCDCVLIPYKNVEASSGILGHAVAAGKPVIGPKEGLLGSLITEYNLGYTINKKDNISIAKLIMENIEKKFSQSLNTEFLSNRTVTVFSEKILRN